MSKNKFESLKAWQEAHKLVLLVYNVTTEFPSDEKFRMVDQLCRSASSVAANLVEGSARSYRKEYTQFAYQSRGSLGEMKYHLLLARDLGYVDNKKYNQIMLHADEVGRLINGLISYLKTNNQDQRSRNQDLKK